MSDRGNDNSASFKACWACGRPNPEVAQVCVHCSNLLSPSEDQSSDSDPERSSSDSPRSERKRPLLAAALNLVPLPVPLGYLYLGLSTRFNWSVLLRIVGFIFGFVFWAATMFSCGFDGDYCTDSDKSRAIIVPLFVIGSTLVASALDAYTAAQER